MRKLNLFMAVISIVICLYASSSAQQPCQPGTLATVIGTTCSVGPLILNFPTFVDNGQGASSPAAIGFSPVISGNQAGFVLQTNFVDAPGANSAHLIQFAYIPQAAPAFEIRAADLEMDASAQGSSQGTSFVQIIDFQNYPPAGFVATGTALDVEQNTVVTSQLSNHVFLQVPAFASTGDPLAPFTSQIFSFSTGNSGDALSSATFLYTLGPILPDPPAAALTYSNIDLPNAANTTVSNINNSGQMVGTFQDTDGIFHGYLTRQDGQITIIDFPGASGTFGEGLNDQGDVTGFYNDAAGVSHGFIWQAGNFATLDFPGALFTQPIAINNQGQVVGSYESADQGFPGFLFDNGQFTTIVQGPGTGLFASTSAFAINNRGEIAGTFFDPDTFRAFVGRNSSFNDFDVPGQGNTVPGGINDQGSIVGGYDDINLVQHGFVLAGDTFRTVDFPGSNDSFALGINASGQIVGIYSDAVRIFHSFLAVPGSAGNGVGTNSPNSASSSPSISRPVCGSDEWKGRVKRWRDPRCHVSH